MLPTYRLGIDMVEGSIGVLGLVVDVAIVMFPFVLL